MPQLPTLTVTQPQADRLLAVFGDVAGYKVWLLASLKAKVMEAEMNKARVDAQAYVEAKRTALEIEMGGIS